MSNDCGVCMEECKENLTCGSCNTTYCIDCSQTYLLSVSEAHCMGCKKIWDERFLRDHFPKAWMNKNYKNKIKNVLFEKELSYIPASMTLAGRVNTHKRDLAKYHEYMANDHSFDQQINKLKKELALLGLGNAIENKEKIKEITTEIKNLTTKKTKIQKVSLPNKISLDPDAVERFRRDGTRYYTTVHITEEEKQVKNTSVKCPIDSCLGYLDSNNHCNACNKDICKKCNQEKVKDHKCKKEDIETVEYLQKNTKGCPKCGIRTSKVDGCFGKDIPIPLWNGNIKMSQNIIIGDELIGDDGNKRVVLDVCKGTDKLYSIKQTNGVSYIVNSKHTLFLKFTEHKKLSWNKDNTLCKIKWFDINDKCIRVKHFKINNELLRSKVIEDINIFLNNIKNNNEIELKVDEYMNLPDSQKKQLYGVKSLCETNYKTKDVKLDPYLLGLWLGDGINTGMCFAINSKDDPEILEYILKWCNENDSELVHEDQYTYRIRRKNYSLGKKAIGHGSSMKDCVACKKSKYPNAYCDLSIGEDKDYSVKKSINFNKLKHVLSEYNLIKNKHIPDDYMYNSKDIRLKVLAGLIDTDGHVCNDGKRIVISQTNEHIASQIEHLSRNLGFVTNVTKQKRKEFKFYNQEVSKLYKDINKINISGTNASIIPTTVHRKKCIDSTPNKDYALTSIKVSFIGEGEYFGWKINENNRFVLQDKTIVKNCDQMWCVDCKTAWNWSTGDIVTGHIHNPEYFRYMRERGLQIPQNPNREHNYNNRNYGCVDREIFDMRFNLLFRERGVRNVGLENFNIGKYTVSHLHTFCDNLFRHLDNFRIQNGRKSENRGLNGLQELGIYYREVHEFDTYKVKRISYIMKNITEEEFKSGLIKGHREMEYKNMIYLLCETLTMVIEDTLRKVQEFLVTTAMPAIRPLSGEYFSKEVFDELLNYMDYFNNESKKISELFGYRKHFQVTIDKEKSKVIVKQPKCIKVKKDSEEEESDEETEEESEEERYILKSKKKD